MSFDENPIDIYFTSPQDIKGKLKPRTDEEGVVEYDMDDYPPRSRPYSMTSEYSMTGEYVLTPSCSRAYSMTGEYVLPDPKLKNYGQDIPADMQQPRPKKTVIQDEYDEDHYTLARPTESYADTVHREKSLDGEKKDSNLAKRHDTRFHLTKKKIPMCVLSSSIFLFVLGGVGMYFGLRKEGMNN